MLIGPATSMRTSTNSNIRVFLSKFDQIVGEVRVRFIPWQPSTSIMMTPVGTQHWHHRLGALAQGILPLLSRLLYPSQQHFYNPNSSIFTSSKSIIHNSIYMMWTRHGLTNFFPFFFSARSCGLWLWRHLAHLRYICFSWDSNLCIFFTYLSLSSITMTLLSRSMN